MADIFWKSATQMVNNSLSDQHNPACFLENMLPTSPPLPLVDSQADADHALEYFRDVVGKSQHIIVVAGAGLSAASGQVSSQHAAYERSDFIVWNDRNPHISRWWGDVAISRFN